jgi:hypothetical protein
MSPEVHGALRKVIVRRMMMDLDDFADYRITVGKAESLTLRHNNCSEHYVEEIKLWRPLKETNLKWLMLKATTHWQEVHADD